MATRDHRRSWRSAFRQALSALGAVGLLGAAAADAAVERQRDALDARVNIVRQVIRNAPTAQAGVQRPDAAPDEQVAQCCWNNWVNWGNWGNWNNWPNWVNWGNWFNR
jgi:hypothetical protein